MGPARHGKDLLKSEILVEFSLHFGFVSVVLPFLITYWFSPFFLPKAFDLVVEDNAALNQTLSQYALPTVHFTSIKNSVQQGESPT
jgi:hypothetical protein